ncbi:MAG: DUF3311 domain-containing protein [Parvibaculum sp.]|uniref:DUF3311 domain-containing protein n=1 Tax=Parvibaculum sp. TaxID=2024848 RepID=UPI00284EF742|nr:DUF3311 domain-containing protein [Parvibaculum sp.]MDR3499323.1 DUF3311 domain-containing protein [Parvibaculum sp.]
MASTEGDSKGVGRAKRRWLIPLIFIPFVATLWVPFYDTIEPALAGVPFFYWYQLMWIAISALLTVIVYFATE